MEAWPGRWRQWWIAFTSDVDVAPFLADHGFAPRTSFLSELGHRLRRKLLPGTPETTDLADLFDLLLPSSFDRRWLLALDTATLNDARTLLFSDEASTPATSSRWSTVLLDGLTFCVGQIVATGFASEIRVRMDAAARRNRPFTRCRPCWKRCGMRSRPSAPAVRRHRLHPRRFDCNWTPVARRPTRCTAIWKNTVCRSASCFACDNCASASCAHVS